jgi:hypothetical protein
VFDSHASHSLNLKGRIDVMRQNIIPTCLLIAAYAVVVIGIALGVAACGQDSGPLAPLGQDTVSSAPTVTINGVELLKAPDGGLALNGNGNGNGKCSTYDDRTINNNGGTLSVCDAELVIHHHSFPRVEQLWMQTGDTREDGLWSYEFGPSGTQFENTPATMTVFVTAAELQAMGLDPDQLSIAYVTSPNHEDWQVIGVDYDWDSQSISAPVWHFSRYALCIE